jgi:hypothetical protein
VNVTERSARNCGFVRDLIAKRELTAVIEQRARIVLCNALYPLSPMWAFRVLVDEHLDRVRRVMNVV